jgi:hypothetical protein
MDDFGDAAAGAHRRTPGSHPAGKKGKNELLQDLLTPVAKTYPSEMGVLSVSQGLQILGG